MPRKWPKGYYAYVVYKNDVPIYVGQGKRDRAYHAVYKRKGVKLSVTLCESQEEARLLERELIQKFGRKDLGNGPLENRTDGLGRSGFIFTEEQLKKIRTKRKPLTEEHKRKLSVHLMGNTRMLGFKHSEQTKEKLRASSTGRRWTGCAKIKLMVTKLTCDYTPEQRAAFSRGGKTNVRNPR